jgi:hypothetical protein
MTRVLRFALFVALPLIACGDDAPDADAMVADAGPADGGSLDAGPPDAGLAWPNAESRAASDPWIHQHHDEITVMRPRVMALNFVNRRNNAEMVGLVEDVFAAVREGTRNHGYDDRAAEPFVEYELAYAVDLRDETPPSGWAYNNSTLYPREDPVDGYWGFDYERLFTEEYAAHFGVEDPDAPGTYLTLCELSERGLVHEVWMYVDADVPDASAAEVLGLMPAYDDAGNRVELSRCAGNGCFDPEDEIPAECTRTLRIGTINNTRGVGCYMESLSHGIEWIGNGNHVPYFTRYWKELAGFDLDVRYGVPFDSWYSACNGSGRPCLTYGSATSVTYRGSFVGTIDPYVPVCGNAHFPPNASDHYDIVSPTTVSSTCRGYRTGGGPGAGDPESPITASDWDAYRSLAPDCTGAWIVWWWQSFPGLGNAARDESGAPMKNWWPFLFY